MYYFLASDYFSHDCHFPIRFPVKFVQSAVHYRIHLLPICGPLSFLIGPILIGTLQILANNARNRRTIKRQRKLSFDWTLKRAWVEHSRELSLSRLMMCLLYIVWMKTKGSGRKTWNECVKVDMKKLDLVTDMILIIEINREDWQLETLQPWLSAVMRVWSFMYCVLVTLNVSSSSSSSSSRCIDG